MFALALLAAAAQTAAIHALVQADVRVATIGDRLARAGACPGQVAAPGLILQDAAQYSGRDRAAARTALGLADAPTVVAVVPDSAAARAGLRAGDIVLSVDGVSMAEPVSGNAYARVGRVESLIDAASRSGATRIRVRRIAVNVDAMLSPVAGCATRFQIVPNARINAQADGTYVQVFTGMVDFVRDDDELAAVLAHELAHNILRHRVDGTPSKQAEYEADRLSVSLVARAGFRVDAIVPFWTRFEKRTSAGIFADGTHPSPAKRLAALRAAVEAVPQASVPPAQ